MCLVHKFDPKNKKKLFSALRQKVLPAKKTLQRYGLKKGMMIADIGCGNGYFSLAASEVVGAHGSVYAFDISSEMLEDLKDKIRQKGLSNISVSLSGENHIPAQDCSADLAFLCNMLHETADLDRFIKEVKRIIKADGKIVIIDWEKTESVFGPPEWRRLDKRDAAKALREHRFKYIRVGSISSDFYVITARK
jgi:ubiquinone/menaquinone biosynthesis C-methylase UbiE